ncbi:MAG TPA: MFS transporter, partial [Reyranellaceae bacterium]|nr:MFS transporter [Reyranellaceae bacterium]
MTPVVPRPTLTPSLLVLLALLSAFTPLSIDMYLPALPVIAQDLNGSIGDIQLTLSAFMIAFGAGQIFYGPAGDRFGRRPVILACLAALGLDYLVMGFAPAIGWLFAGRAIAGMAGVSFTAAYAYLADVSAAHQRAQNFGLVGAAFG